jgi:hypothetical protein
VIAEEANGGLLVGRKLREVHHMSNSLRLCSFDESDLLRFGALRGVRQQERSVDTL